ncbi:MAG: thioredoxin family protein [Runella slithyformis]|nr:MAG: thioredoxin family protein [Runella slithyformis]TAF93660.1 MAG: thioredoxin family protein [Runella sp.]TAG19221.1 MAG: thioredoxin family protein [Cytophagales bacterium]TAG38473.1 MAG: thioredoxin family protein [Cytophagia bacterium]TAF02296.1 MAG: thioredoxin family protein [Runella slithyformis]
MKTILTVVITFVFTAAIAQVKVTPAQKTEAASTGIQFTEGAWGKILEKAKKEKKLIFFDAYASWCGPCKQLQKQVFTRQDVGDFFNKNFINVKKDMEEGEGPMLASVYPLDAYPTLFFIDGNGKMVKKFVGGLPPADLIALGKSVVKK